MFDTVRQKCIGFMSQAYNCCRYKKHLSPICYMTQVHQQTLGKKVRVERVF